jgi:hypothetical protein
LLSGIARGVPIGGCDPPHAASNAAAALMLRARRLWLRVVTCNVSFRPPGESY